MTLFLGDLVFAVVYVRSFRELKMELVTGI